MAKAVKTPAAYNVTLALNAEEAETLRAVCQRIGGDSSPTRRQYMDNIGSALAAAGVKAADIDTEGHNRAIYFTK